MVHHFMHILYNMSIQFPVSPPLVSLLGDLVWFYSEKRYRFSAVQLFDNRQTHAQRTAAIYKPWVQRISS